MEVVFAASIFAIIVVSVYNNYATLTTLISVSRDKIVAADLLNEQFEIVRNLKFSDIGITTGIPIGVLTATSTIVRDARIFVVARTIRNIDDPFDGTIGGEPNDLSPADYKLVEISVSCEFCKNFNEMSAMAHFAPKSLETASDNGALFIKVFDASGVPVPQARVSVQNLDEGIYIEETTDNNGNLQIVDAPPGINAYRIIATKNGYTTDRTYATSAGNPNPTKPYATVLLQQVTQTSFVIDRVSSLNAKTITNTCAQVPNVGFIISGSKIIGTLPDVLKWAGTFSTDGNGLKEIPNLEWDSYDMEINTPQYLAGTNPILPLLVLPDSSQNLDMVVSFDTPSMLLVVVKDEATGQPISGAEVRISGASAEQVLIADQGVMRQTDWSGGSGQLNFTNPTGYHSSDGNIEINDPQGELKLLSFLGDFVPSGNLTSSIFDTGTSSNWGELLIKPVDQDLATGANSVRFQIATSPDNEPETIWEFKGPDGTSESFYTIVDNDINPIHDGSRYIRYKIFLSTADSNMTPNIADVFITFASECIPPGQVFFSNLNNGSHNIEVTATGFAPQTISNFDVDNDWQKTEVLLLPE